MMAYTVHGAPHASESWICVCFGVAIPTVKPGEQEQRISTEMKGCLLVIQNTCNAKFSPVLPAHFPLLYDSLY